MNSVILQRIVAIEALSAKANFKSVHAVGAAARQAEATMAARLV